MSYVISEADLKTVIAQLETARAITPAGDRGLIDGPLSRLRALLGAVPVTTPAPSNPAPTVPVTSVPSAPVRVTAARLLGARGVNWSCYEDGRKHVAPSAEYLRRVQQIRLPITWDYDVPEINTLLSTADSVPGAIVWVECHSYGRVGNARGSNGVTTGPLATPEQIAAQSVRIFKDFGHHPSFRMMLDNEPMHAPGAWEQCTQAAATALGKAGYTGVLVVSLSQASNVGAGPKNHPRPWIQAPAGIDVVYNGHHYPEGQEERTGQTVAQLDAYAKGRGFADYSAFIKAWFNWGLLGSNAWKSASIIIGETFFHHDQHLRTYLALAGARNVGVFLWADGVWNTGYGYKVTESHLKALDDYRS